MGSDQGHVDQNLRRMAEMDSAMRMSRRRFLRTSAAFGMTATAAGLLAACGAGATAAPTSAPSAAASAAAASAAPASAAGGKIGGKLRFYCWEGFEGTKSDYLTKWRTDNGVELISTFVASPDEMLAKIRTDPGNVDVTTTHVETYYRVYDLLEPIDTTRLANYSKIWPALRSKRWSSFPDGKMYCVPLAWGDAPTIYDPKKWDGPPDTYMALADAKYKGTIASPDDVFMNFWGVSRSIGNANPMYLTQKQLDDVVAAWKKIKPNIVALTPDAMSSIVDLLVRGDASIAPFGGWEPMVQMGKDKGKELAFATPKVDSCFWWVDNYAIPKASTNKDTAYAYIDQCLSGQGNADIANFTASGCTNTDSYALLDASVQGFYPWDAVKVENPPDTSPVMVSMDPPAENAGDIVGIEAWQRAWQEAKLG
jgi:putative spermidine/putrescine transport system substrate-binding protein